MVFGNLWKVSKKMPEALTELLGQRRMEFVVVDQFARNQQSFVVGFVEGRPL